MSDVKNEHEDKRTLKEDIFYPDHVRTESPTFRATKLAGHKANKCCMISGHTEKVEYHHSFCEYAFMLGVDWTIVKGVATGTITDLPKLDLHTDQPTSETFAAKDSMLWLLCKMAEIRGFDWSTFDPAKPEEFVDCMAHMWPLHEKFHRATGHGIHMETFPVWSFQALPRIAGFIYTADEE